ncbi:hypothetical protein PENANT_c011G03677 [Penicillium antarcticum]|uniref:Uncharacterized protein n=1 Tax=Penicillium antarcticum TaxID=416450 RepID=A0A1V6Q7S2_9EURO|nr:hypothetical protein PENANT_c011G03677 [Penicillium antarcticum]
MPVYLLGGYPCLGGVRVKKRNRLERGLSDISLTAYSPYLARIQA